MAKRARKKTSKRPPKFWLRHCIAKVKAAGKEANARKVCGNNWYNVMDQRAKRRAKRRHPER